MSLIKKPEMTEKKVAANARNRKLAHGPATDEGRERIRTAHLRHGFYSQAEEAALRALGEDPAQYQQLLEDLWEEWKPVGAMQEGLVIRLRRCMWLTNRADRMLEGCAVQQAQEMNRGRLDRLHAKMMRLKLTAESLGLFVQAVAREHYVTTPEDLEKMKNLHQEGVVKEMGEMALALFYRLQPPGAGEDGLDPMESARRMVDQVKEIFGIGLHPPYAPPSNAPPGSSPVEDDPQDAEAPEEEIDHRYPSITAAEWEARVRPRLLLENILKRQVEICEEQHQALLKESVKGPSPYERATEIAPTHPNARTMRRMQDSNFREARRIINLLLKLKRHELKMKALGERAEKQSPVSRDMLQNKGVIRGESKPLKSLSHSI
jgi:hypothetical protein